MNILSKAWEKAVRFMDNNSDKNLMHVNKAQAIYDRVNKQTGYNVTCEFSRWASHRTNVGLALPEGISIYHIWHAEARFVEAMKDIAGLEMKREDILHYKSEDVVGYPSPLAHHQ